MPAKAARKVEAKPATAALAREYLKLERKIEPERKRQAEIKTQLVAVATERGNFREVVPGFGHLTVSGNKDKEFKGRVLIADVAAFEVLRADQQERLLAAGVVSWADEYSNPTYGRVTPKLF